MGKIGRRLFQHLVTLAVGMGRVDKKFRLVNVTSVDVKKIINDEIWTYWFTLWRPHHTTTTTTAAAANYLLMVGTFLGDE